MGDARGPRSWTLKLSCPHAGKGPVAELSLTAGWVNDGFVRLSSRPRMVLGAGSVIQGAPAWQGHSAGELRALSPAPSVSFTHWDLEGTAG